MRQSKFIVALLVVVSFAVAVPNAIAKKKPEWINGSSKEYASPRYFIGVGQAVLDKGSKKQVMEMAGNRARAEIAKTLRSDVSVTASSGRELKSESKPGSKPKVSGTSRQGETVVVRASEIMDGVEIKEYYEDKKDKMLYALAVLDRVKSAKLVEARIDRTRNDILSEMETGKGLQEEGRYLAAMGHYSRAREFSLLIAPQKELLAVLEPAGVGLKAGDDYTSEITRLMETLKGKLRFVLELKGPAESVRPYVIKGLTKAGFVSGAATANDGYKLVGTTDLTPKGSMEMSENLKVQVYNASLDLEVQDPKSGEIVTTMSWSVNANEKTAEMAQKSAMRNLGMTVEKQISDKLMEGL